MLAVVAALLVSAAPLVSPVPTNVGAFPHQYRIGGMGARPLVTATLTTRVVDRYGKPGADSTGHAINVATGDGEFLSVGDDGVARTELAPGTYDVTVLSNTVGPDGIRELTAVVNRQVTITDTGGETTVDARPAQPVTAKVDRSGATVVDSSVTVASQVGGTGLVNTYFTGPNARVYAVPSPAGRQTFVYRPVLGGKDFRYHLVHVGAGLPNAPVYHTPDRRLARFDTTYHGREPGVEGNNGKPAAVPGLNVYRFFDLDMPGKRTEYYTADPSVTWFTLRVGADAAHSDQSFAPGVRRTSWFRSPVGVGWGSITRNGTELNVDVRPFAPSDDKRREGSFGTGGEGKTVLLEDGVEVGASETVGTGSFSLPDPNGRYTLRTSGSRDTTVAAEWEFDAARTQDLFVVRLGVNGQNLRGQVPAGSNHELTLAIDPQRGSTVTRTGVPSLEISYDGGESWRRASVGWGDRRGNAWLVEPRAKGFVSLRVSATDQHGTRFTQTLLRAYELI